MNNPKTITPLSCIIRQFKAIITPKKGGQRNRKKTKETQRAYSTRKSARPQVKTKNPPP